MSNSSEKFMFYDSPPFATGLPHYGHILSGSWFYYPHRVDRSFGWDCHRLPVEYEIDKSLGISNRDEIVKMGIDRYNHKCRGIVMKYSGEWKVTVERRWISKVDTEPWTWPLWRVFGIFLRKKVLTYRGFRVMPFSITCSTPPKQLRGQPELQGSDPSVVISFPLLKPLDGHKASVVAWTLLGHCHPAVVLIQAISMESSSTMKVLWG